MTGLGWRPSPSALTAATVAGAALSVAVVGAAADFGSWRLLLFAAPILGALSTVAFARPARGVEITAEPAELRCFEGEEVEVRGRARPVGGEAVLRVRPVVDGGEVTAGAPMTSGAGDGDSAPVRARVSAARWGRYPVGAHVAASAAAGMLTATATVRFAEIKIYPTAMPAATVLPRTRLPDRIGTHVGSRAGAGVEFAGIRPFVPGDHLRAVNWRVTARRGKLHVTERHTERAADVVALIDAYPQAPGPASDGLERAVRGATQVVQTALRVGDRAGVVVSGGRPRWLGPDIGRRQFYRVLDTVLDAAATDAATSEGADRPGSGRSTGTLAPRAAVPPGAIVIGFSTLVETAFTLALIDLRARGHTVVLVDVLRGTPFAEQLDELSERVWSLERANMHRDLRSLGIDVVRWQEGATLDQSLELLLTRPPWGEAAR